MSDGDGPPLIERARAGDWDAIEDLVGGAIAPTFDAALHLFEAPERAVAATEDALLAILLAARRGELSGRDPLEAAAASLAAAARAAGSDPFATGLGPDDLVTIGRRPDDARGAALGKVPKEARVIAVLALALDLEPEAVSRAAGCEPEAARQALRSALEAVPHEDPPAALRDVLDARASRSRLPADVADRVLDRFERT